MGGCSVICLFPNLGRGQGGCDNRTVSGMLWSTNRSGSLRCWEEGSDVLQGDMASAGDPISEDLDGSTLPWFVFI